MPQFVLTRWILGPTELIELSEEEAREGLSALSGLLVALGVEEKANLLLENHFEFEQTLLELTLRQSMFGNSNWSEFIGDIHQVARRLSNLLSMARLYIDQVKHDFASIELPDAFEPDEVKKAFSAEYDEHLGYRVMEAIRNYMQHRSLPVHSITYPSTWLPPKQYERLRFRIEPRLNPIELAGDSKFKSSVLAELEGQERVNLVPLVREYVECLGRIHESFRNRMAPAVENWDECVGNLLDRARARWPKGTVGVVIGEVNEAGELSKLGTVFDSPIKRRKELIAKDNNLSSLASRYVSGLAEG